MRLLELVVAILVGMVVMAFLLGQCPIHRTLRWKGKVTGDGE